MNTPMKYITRMAKMEKMHYLLRQHIKNSLESLNKVSIGKFTYYGKQLGIL